jgi:hypothetical protein
MYILNQMLPKWTFLTYGYQIFWMRNLLHTWVIKDPCYLGFGGMWGYLRTYLILEEVHGPMTFKNRLHRGAPQFVVYTLHQTVLRWPPEGELGRARSTQGRYEKCLRSVSRKTLSEVTWCSWESSIKRILKKNTSANVDWIHLAQDHWRSHENEPENFLTSWETNSLSIANPKECTQ